MPETDRARIARDAAEGLRRFTGRLHDNGVLIGLDGFVDSIITVVDTREDTEQFTPVPNIERFGRKILAAAGQSSNIELVVDYQKLGGNGPIMANCMATTGLPVTYIGALGYPDIHPVFEQFAQQARCFSLAAPGQTDALEFEDGKVMLGKLQTLRDVNWSRLLQVVGLNTLSEIIGRSRLIGMTNWTMLTEMNGIWEGLIEQVLPKLPQPPGGRRVLFVDLADPRKRSAKDIAAAMELLKRFETQLDVVLGLNLSESGQIAAVAGLEVPDSEADAIEAIEPTARAIRQWLDITGVVVHPRQGAAAAMRPGEGGDARSARFEGPFVRSPRLSTGAGDNFNAGFCLGLMADLPLEQALCVGTATSGFYVREARSATLSELATFCAELPEPEAAGSHGG